MPSRLSTPAEVCFYAVRNGDGKWLRTKGRRGYGSKWTSKIQEAKFYPNAATAKGQATFFANRWPEHGVPDVVVFTATEAGVLTDETKAEEWRPT
jgi:hypothetical protein